MPKTKKMTKPIERLALTIDSFIGYIRSLPEGKLQASPSTSWGIREVLVHLVFWHEQYASITKAILSGKKPELLTGTFKKLNTYAVDKNKSVSIPALINRWLESEGQLERVMKKADSKDITLQLSFREGSKVWRFDEVLDRIEKHIRGHLDKIKRHGKN